MLDELFGQVTTDQDAVIEESPDVEEITIETISIEDPETISEGAEPVITDPEVPMMEEAEPEVVPIEPVVIAEPVIVPVAAPRKRRGLSSEEADAIRVHYKD